MSAQNAERLAAILRDVDVDVLTIYDDHGNYGHPTHPDPPGGRPGPPSWSAWSASSRPP
jgi:hypothetical protein